MIRQKNIQYTNSNLIDNASEYTDEQENITYMTALMFKNNTHQNSSTKVFIVLLLSLGATFTNMV